MRLVVWKRSLALGIGLLGVLASGVAPGAAPSPPLTILELSSKEGSAALRWNDLGPGYSYSVQTCDTLRGSVWQTPAATVWPISEFTWADPLPLHNASRYYRVVGQTAEAQRGRVLSVAPLAELLPDQIQALFSQVGVTVKAQYPVQVSKVIYETVNPFQLRTTASGLLAWPDYSTNALPLVSYQHGTIVAKAEAPSSLRGLEPLVGLAFASAGYVAAVPDYVGLGDSPGLHPFIHAGSEAAAAVDILRAARTFCATNGIGLNGQLFLIGYSQGGHATMATQREIETNLTNEFHLTASAPMAGPYSLSKVVLEDFLSDRPMPNPYYFLYLLVAYQSIYHMVESFADILVSPYDRTLPALMDGNHDSGALNQAIGNGSPKKLVKPEFLNALRDNPQHPMRLALRANDLTEDWTPRVPTRLYHCTADEDVLFANSQTAYEAFVARGAPSVEFLGKDLPLSHGDCAPVVLLRAKEWFDSLVVK